MRPNPGCFLTEAEEDDVQTVCKVLAPLCCLPELVDALGLFRPAHQEQLGAVSLALMAETVSRGARIQIVNASKAQPLATSCTTLQEVSAELLRRALNIDESSVVMPQPDDIPEPVNVVQACTYDEAAARKASGKFFAHQWSNCQPVDVLACLTLARAFAAFPAAANGCSVAEALCWQGAVADSPLVTLVLEHFRAASMRTFFQEFVPAAAARAQFSAVDYQIALYVQGLEFFTAKTRRSGLPSLLDPVAVAQDAARRVRERIYQSHVAAKMARLRSQMVGCVRRQ